MREPTPPPRHRYNIPWITPERRLRARLIIPGEVLTEIIGGRSLETDIIDILDAYASMRRMAGDLLQMLTNGEEPRQ